MPHLPFEFYFTVDAGSVRSYMPDVPVLLPASSWYRFDMRRPNLPQRIQRRAADPGGFQASFCYGGRYPFSPATYVLWCRQFRPQWAATFDFPCLEQFCATDAEVEARQRQTTEFAWKLWQEYRNVPWAWVPTVQGWSVEQYQSHARQLLPLLEEMRSHYEALGNADWRVGIGTLCRRPAQQVRRIVQAVSEELPEMPFHLWGVKLDFFQSKLALPQQVISSDSSAWNMRIGGRDRWKHYKQHSGRGDLTLRQWAYQHALPCYREKVETALAQPKQIPLIEL